MEALDCTMVVSDSTVEEQGCIGVALDLTAARAAQIVVAWEVIAYSFTKSRPIYLVDFVCYRGSDSSRVPISSFIEHLERWGHYNKETLEFQTKVMERSGIGNKTYLPLGFHVIPPNHTLNSTMEEFEMVLFVIVQNLFTKHNINPKDIDILITNCGLVCPVPSLSALVINKFKFRSNIKSYNLSGMGCSASILSMSLAKELLKLQKHSLALILSMESVSSSGYKGKIKSMLLANCLFRMGGAAILLSNRKQDKQMAKYELQHLVRTHLGAKDSSYKCVFQESDYEGYIGISLSRSILHVAGEALTTNLTTLATLVLPYSELIKYGLLVVWKKIWPSTKKKGPYVPNFKKAFDHFCIHAGGKSVIDGIKEHLKLRDRDIEASKMTLHRFGNTSSSSIWYSLSYLEAKNRVNKGDKVWQLAFGSGFKCNSIVWKCVTKKSKLDSYNVWYDDIDKYPINVPDVIDH
ncbi:3-ketoacyl-CoA synthase 7-like [Carica papaya]|uniref:3-ketoacyl-CoA synthase 7-like n=1 Tax=Carica papaya TaxID=3649 RepID=UPI000B8CDD97|nr:3-ketoacyl-CoA synthase 7-like [Carica papaya]